jgi:hypothetical protein
MLLLLHALSGWQQQQQQQRKVCAPEAQNMW